MADVPKDIMEAAIAVHEAMMRADIEDEPLILALALLSERERRTAQGVMDLSWSNEFEPNDACPYNHCFASSQFGTFQIEWKSWKDHDSYVLYLDGDFIAAHHAMVEIKKRATEHLAQRAAPSLSTSAGGGERG